MNLELALKIFDAVLLSARKKIKKSILAQFFSGFDLKELIDKAKERYQNLGFFIYEDNEYVELVNRPELASYLINFFGLEENQIIQDLLEVLAIVAYGGPIKLKEIDQLRGKRSSSLLKELVSRGFIKKEKSYYQISPKLLKILGFNRQEDLPDYHEVRKELRKAI